MGRLLLALDLGEVLSPVAWLSLSATIADHKDRYYRAFADSEHPLGRGDTTMFAETMLSIVAESLNRLLQDLIARSDQLDALSQRMENLSIPAVGDGPTVDPEQSDDLRAVLFILGQASLFGPPGVLTLEELALSRDRSKQSVRPHTQHLERLGLIDAGSRRPLRFRPSRQGSEPLGLAGGGGSDSVARRILLAGSAVASVVALPRVTRKTNVGGRAGMIARVDAAVFPVAVVCWAPIGCAPMWCESATKAVEFRVDVDRC